MTFIMIISLCVSECVISKSSENSRSKVITRVVVSIQLIQLSYSTFKRKKSIKSGNFSFLVWRRLRNNNRQTNIIHLLLTSIIVVKSTCICLPYTLKYGYGMQSTVLSCVLEAISSIFCLRNKIFIKFT